MGCEVGFIRKVVLCTHYFKGNYPDTFSLEVSLQKDLKGVEYNVDWTEVIPKVFILRKILITIDSSIS
jgi:allantoicase